MSDEAVLSQSQRGQNNCTGTIVPVNCFWNCSDSGAPENVSEEAELFNNSSPKNVLPDEEELSVTPIANIYQIKRNCSVSIPPEKCFSEEVAIKNSISDQAEVFTLIGSLKRFCLQPTDMRTITT